MNAIVLTQEQIHNQRASGIEASHIGPRLWQGAKPPEGRAVFEAGFRVLVLTALEYQPLASRFHGVEVLHAPLDDSGERPISDAEWKLAQRAADLLAAEHRRGRRILVTCQQGRNRSGLVTALILHTLTGMSGTACIHHVRTHRKAPSGPALTNDSFVAALGALPGRPPPRLLAPR